MNIDPDNLNFSEIRDMTKEADVEALQIDFEEGLVVTRANSEEALKKLQDDLRRAGYNKVK